MSLLSLLPWALLAVLVFWAVGAYNRLVGLRAVIRRRFGPIDQQLAARSVLLLQLIDGLAHEPEVAAHDLEALRAARSQANSALDVARARPSSAESIKALRVAMQILVEARKRLTGVPKAPEHQPLVAELAACDNALRFAQDQFNDAVQEYNAAVSQFPTGLLATVFQFRGAMPI